MFPNEDKHEKVAWSTDKINHLMTLIDEGFKPKTNPFYEGNPNLRKGNIIFEYTEKEIKEIKKCASDIVYFANTYCTVMTDGGLMMIKLRDYQEKMVKQFSDKEKRFNIVLAARQVGKCHLVDTQLVMQITNIEILNMINKKYFIKENIVKLPFFELLKIIKTLKKEFKLLDKIKYKLYKMYSYLSNS